MTSQLVLAHLKAKLPGLQAVYVFGSQASGLSNADSDLDVAIVLPGLADPLVLWELAGELADIFALPVDLLDLRAASTVMQYQIVTTGQRIWGDDLQIGVYESFILSDKTELDAARRGLLEDIQREGRVHGG